jgi:hypothetical protein
MGELSSGAKKGRRGESLQPLFVFGIEVLNPGLCAGPDPGFAGVTV